MLSAIGLFHSSSASSFSQLLLKKTNHRAPPQQQRSYLPPLLNKEKRMSVRCMATGIPADGVPDIHPLELTESMAESNSFSSAPKSHEQSQTDDDYKKGVKYLVDTAPATGMKQLPPEYVLSLPQNPLSASYGDIPVIDLSGLSGPPESRISTVKTIGSACASWGIFRIVNHGVEVGLMEEMMKVAEGFFGLSLTEKMRYASDDVMSPVRYGTSLNTSKKHSLHWRDFLRHHGHPFQESFHLWPLNPPNYRDVAKEYLEQVWKLAMRIGGAISEGLGVDEGYMEKRMLGDGLQIMAVNYYPACPEPERTLGQACHSDHGAITILMDNGVDGLQVKHNGSWVAIPHVPASFLVNLGDCTEIVSNGKYKSVEHRAAVSREKTRISVAVANGPNLSRCIGPWIEDGGMKFRAVLYEEYLRMQQTSTVREKSALDALRIL